MMPAERIGKGEACPGTLFHGSFLIMVASTALRIVIACGGTGGHLFPGIAVAEEMRARGHEVMLLISGKKVDREASEKYAHLRFETVEAIAKPSTLSPKMIPFLWKLWRTARQCRSLLTAFQADAVLGMGGFTSLPPVYAGHKLGLATFIHDSNARPGRANILTSRFCTRVFVGMQAGARFFTKRPVTLTGTPVRAEIRSLPARETAAAKFGLDPARPILLVTGGSQGARRLNLLAAEAAPLLPTGIQVLHIAGSFDFDRVTDDTTGRTDYHTLGFCADMPSAYAVANLVVARAGASSLTELAHAGLPSILVPYPFAADDHQTRNAEVFAQAGAARLVQETALTAVGLAEIVTEIFGDLQTRESMAQAARALDVPDAAARVCLAIETTCLPPP